MQHGDKGQPDKGMPHKRTGKQPPQHGSNRPKRRSTTASTGSNRPKRRNTAESTVNNRHKRRSITASTGSNLLRLRRNSSKVEHHTQLHCTEWLYHSVSVSAFARSPA